MGSSLSISILAVSPLLVLGVTMPVETMYFSDERSNTHESHNKCTMKYLIIWLTVV